MMTKARARWAVARKTGTTDDVNTTASRYPVMGYVPFRRAFTRQQARHIKQSLKHPQNYMIVDTLTGEAVR